MAMRFATHSSTETRLTIITITRCCTIAPSITLRKSTDSGRICNSEVSSKWGCGGLAEPASDTRPPIQAGPAPGPCGCYPKMDPVVFQTPHGEKIQAQVSLCVPTNPSSESSGHLWHSGRCHGENPLSDLPTFFTETSKW